MDRPRPPVSRPLVSRLAVSRAALALAAAALAAACSSGAPAAGTPAAGAPAAGSAASSPAAPASAQPVPAGLDVPEPTQKTRWLCLPGAGDNPCEGGLDATVVEPDGSTSVEEFVPARRPAVDCFYVYPTVSDAPGLNAPRRSAPEVVGVARAQAARFAQSCRLYVPVYRQVTTAALLQGRYGDAQASALAYDDVLQAWHDYLLHHNDGRGVVLIGHSQGATVLRKLLQQDVDDVPAVRERVVSAVLLGANVSVPRGADAGADLDNLPACRADDQTGCVVAYSAFADTPPDPSLFGRTANGQQVLCTSPAALSGGAARLRPYLPTERLLGSGLPGSAVPGDYRTGFVTFPDALRARCSSKDGADVLLVSGRLGGTDVAALGRLGEAWGLHTADVNLALGDLVDLVGRQARAYATR